MGFAIAVVRAWTRLYSLAAAGSSPGRSACRDQNQICGNSSETRTTTVTSTQRCIRSSGCGWEFLDNLHWRAAHASFSREDAADRRRADRDRALPCGVVGLGLDANMARLPLPPAAPPPDVSFTPAALQPPSKPNR